MRPKTDLRKETIEKKEFEAEFLVRHLKGFSDGMNLGRLCELDCNCYSTMDSKRKPSLGYKSLRRSFHKLLQTGDDMV